MTKVFQMARSNEYPLLSDICAELEAQFNKQYYMLSELSDLQYAAALTKIATELTVIAERTESQ
jgi:hypothetical protein